MAKIFKIKTTEQELLTEIYERIWRRGDKKDILTVWNALCPYLLLKEEEVKWNEFKVVPFEDIEKKVEENGT